MQCNEYCLPHHLSFRDMDKLLPVFQNCLTSDNPSVTLTALDSILAILPLCHSRCSLCKHQLESLYEAIVLHTHTAAKPSVMIMKKAICLLSLVHVS